jgi:hypothetical protein
MKSPGKKSMFPFGAAMLLALAMLECGATQGPGLNAPVTVLTGTNLTVTASNANVPPAWNEIYNIPSQAVWWSWTAPADGSMVITTEGSEFSVGIAVFTDASIERRTALAGNRRHFFDNNNCVSFAVQSGVEYTKTSPTTFPSPAAGIMRALTFWNSLLMPTLRLFS